jgi:hypothetical protein
MGEDDDLPLRHGHSVEKPSEAKVSRIWKASIQIWARRIEGGVVEQRVECGDKPHHRGAETLSEKQHAAFEEANSEAVSPAVTEIFSF